MIGIKKNAKKRGAVLNKVLEQRRAIVSRLKRLRRDDPFSNTDRSLIVEPGTDAAALYGHEQTVIFEKKLRNDLKETERALKKFKKGTYGICERCKKKIEEKRLEIKPAAIYCIKCEREVESKLNNK